MRTGLIFIAAMLTNAAGLRAEVSINEVLGSTAAEDCEFIELYNGGSKEIDLSGWSIELWDSDDDKSFGNHDADSPIKLRGRIDAGGYFLLANPEFADHYTVKPDQPIKNNAIENSSYTIVLRDDLGEVVEAIFVTDGGEDDKPNINGRVIKPHAVISAPGSRFIPPGFARVPGKTGGKPGYRLLKFSPVPSADATPGGPNPPSPAAAAQNEP